MKNNFENLSSKTFVSRVFSSMFLWLETIIYQRWLIPHKLIDNKALWMILKFWEITISIIIIIFQELDGCSLKIAVIRISICLVLTMESFPVNCVEPSLVSNIPIQALTLIGPIVGICQWKKWIISIFWVRSANPFIKFFAGGQK